jgi:hypothetical protein
LCDKISKRPLDLEPTSTSTSTSTSASPETPRIVFGVGAKVAVSTSEPPAKKNNAIIGSFTCDRSQKVTIDESATSSLFGSYVVAPDDEIRKQRMTFINRLKVFKTYLSLINRNFNYKYIWSWIDTIDGDMAKFILTTLGQQYITECVDAGIQFHVIHRSSFMFGSSLYKIFVADQTKFETNMEAIEKLTCGMKWLNNYYCDYYTYLCNIVNKNENMCISGAWINTQNEINMLCPLNSLNYILDKKLHLRGNTSLLGRVIHITYKSRDHVFTVNELMEHSKRMLTSILKSNAINITSYAYDNLKLRNLVLDF